MNTQFPPSCARVPPITVDPATLSSILGEQLAGKLVKVDELTLSDKMGLLNELAPIYYKACRELGGVLDDNIRMEGRGGDPESRRRRQQAKLKKKGEIHNLTTAFNQKNHSLIQVGKSLHEQLIITINAAEYFNIPPVDVDQEKREEYQKICAEKDAQELSEWVKEEAKKEVRRKQKSRKKKQASNSNRQVHKTDKQSEPSPRTQTKGKKVVEFTQKESSISLVEDTISQHRRVIRWHSKNLNELRNFEDRVNGNLEKRYARMQDEELELQRAFHHLPGTEEILINPEYRRRFTFITARGFGMVVKLFRKKVTFEGILYMGVVTKVTSDKVHYFVYHKYFQVMESLEQVFVDSTIEVQEEESPIGEGEWRPVGKYSITPQKDGTLKALFNGESHRLLIYPIKC